MTTNHPTAAILIIGNEILSGRTQDTNVKFIAERLDKVGIRLCEVRVIADNEKAIVETINALRAQYTYIFTTGGIGATHDDITAECLAKAFNVPLEVNEETFTILENHYKESFNASRQRMALMPRGSELLKNQICTATGFKIENVYCLAGMPTVMQNSFTLLLPNLKTGTPFVSNTVTCNLREGDIAHALTDIQNAHLNVEIGSYPFYRTPPDIGTNFVMHGADPIAVTDATNAVIKMVEQFGGTYTVDWFERKDESSMEGDTL
ncbi:MAG: molybdopterin-binding protein [Pseudomonadota bacterium]|nr:molybdopterin-binding protein [Alphaproteobacteria bacterium]MDP5370238.1 molybdopterin-binding protein [Pseudomonadota bacterium]